MIAGSSPAPGSQKLKLWSVAPVWLSSVSCGWFLPESTAFGECISQGKTGTEGERDNIRTTEILTHNNHLLWVQWEEPSLEQH